MLRKFVSCMMAVVFALALAALFLTFAGLNRAEAGDVQGELPPALLVVAGPDQTSPQEIVLRDVNAPATSTFGVLFDGKVFTPVKHISLPEWRVELPQSTINISRETVLSVTRDGQLFTGYVFTYTKDLYDLHLHFYYRPEYGTRKYVAATVNPLDAGYSASSGPHFVPRTAVPDRFVALYNAGIPGGNIFWVYIQDLARFFTSLDYYYEFQKQGVSYGPIVVSLESLWSWSNLSRLWLYVSSQPQGLEELRPQSYYSPECVGTMPTGERVATYDVKLPSPRVYVNSPAYPGESYGALLGVEISGGYFNGGLLPYTATLEAVTGGPNISHTVDVTTNVFGDSYLAVHVWWNNPSDLSGYPVYWEAVFRPVYTDPFQARQAVRFFDFSTSQCPLRRAAGELKFEADVPTTTAVFAGETHLFTTTVLSAGPGDWLVLNPLYFEVVSASRPYTQETTTGGLYFTVGGVTAGDIITAVMRVGDYCDIPMLTAVHLKATEVPVWTSEALSFPEIPCQPAESLPYRLYFPLVLRVE